VFLTDIYLKNFKSHRESEIKPKRITILIGPNSSGKSSILQALLVLKESLNPKGNSRSAPITETESFDLGKYQDVVTNHKLDVPLAIGIMAQKLLPHGLEDQSSLLAKLAYNVEFINENVHFLHFGVESQEFKLSFQFRNNNSTVNATHSFSDLMIPLKDDPHLDGINPRILAQNTNELIGRNFNEYFSNGEFTKHLLDEFYYVPYNRTVTSYGVSLQRNTVRQLSSNPVTMMSLIISKLSKDPTMLDSVSSFINEISGKTIRTRIIDFASSGDSGVTIDFTNKGISNSIINEGTGLNQLILLLATLTEAPKNAIIGIEEPELHLHPSAQSKLAKILMGIAKSHSKQIIFTTHSEHMLYPFLAEVTKGKSGLLSKDEIAIYYITQNDSGLSTIEHLPINEHGQIKGGLKGFWESDLEVFKQFTEKND